jgi:hypothetical protein
MKKSLCILLVGACLFASSAFAGGWACYTQNRSTGLGGRWNNPSRADAERNAMNVCRMTGNGNCVLVKCVPEGSPQDNGCPECKRVR